MRKLFRAWVAIIVAELVIMAMISDLNETKYHLFMLAVIVSSLIIGATYLLIAKDSASFHKDK